MTKQNHSEHLEELVEAFEEIKAGGWHLSSRKGSTGIGKTLEDLLDKEEDNHDLPDFHDIEIKTHETASTSMLTLFTKAPTYPRGANTHLRNNYGTEDDHGNKILHATVSGNKITNSQKYDYNFKIRVEREEEKIVLEVYDKEGVLVDDRVYWSFIALEKQINKKLKYLTIISGDSRLSANGIDKEYRYTEIDVVSDLRVDRLVEGIENGDLKIDIRIGAYQTGKKMGKTHDHGTAFRINTIKLMDYASVERI